MIDPLTGLDPDAPATTLIKNVEFIYEPPPPPPPPPPVSPYRNTGVRRGQSSFTFAVVYPDGSSASVGYAQFVGFGGFGGLF